MFLKISEMRRRRGVEEWSGGEERRSGRQVGRDKGQGEEGEEEEGRRQGERKTSREADK